MRALALAALLLLPLPAFADPAVSVDGAWALQSGTKPAVIFVYLTLTLEDEDADTLNGVTSDAAAAALPAVRTCARARPGGRSMREAVPAFAAIFLDFAVVPARRAAERA